MSELTQLLNQLQLLMLQIKALTVARNSSTVQGKLLCERARRYLGTDASPKDLAPDDLACAESFSTIVNDQFGDFPIVVGTGQLLQVLINHRNFVRVNYPQPGDVIIYATGTGNGRIKHGHVGIVDEDNSKVLSNNSNDRGKWSNHLTIGWMRDYYGRQGGYPEYLFRKIF